MRAIERCDAARVELGNERAASREPGGSAMVDEDRPEVGPSAPAASRFLEALLRRDFGQLEQTFAPNVRFRALVPSGIREAQDASSATDWLRAWFGTSDDFQVLDSGIEEFAGRSRFWYRLALTREGRPTVIDQEGFCDTTTSGISDLALVCSGFRPTHG